MRADRLPTRWADRMAYEMVRRTGLTMVPRTISIDEASEGLGPAPERAGFDRRAMTTWVCAHDRGSLGNPSALRCVLHQLSLPSTRTAVRKVPALTSPRPITAVIFDLDGVIRRWSPSIMKDAEASRGLPAGVLSDAVLGDAALLKQVTTGRITDSEWRHTIASRLLHTYGEAGPSAVREWSTAPGEVVTEVLELVRATRQKTIVALLTNATTRLNDDLDRLGLRTEFDVVFNSSELSLAKPDPAVFAEVCMRLAASPEECAFVDDSPSNVAAAKRAGLVSHLHREFETLQQFLDGLWVRTYNDTRSYPG